MDTTPPTATLAPTAVTTTTISQTGTVNTLATWRQEMPCFKNFTLKTIFFQNTKYSYSIIYKCHDNYTLLIKQYIYFYYLYLFIFYNQKLSIKQTGEINPKKTKPLYFAILFTTDKHIITTNKRQIR